MSLDRKFLEAQMLYEKIIADLEAKLAESEEDANKWKSISERLASVLDRFHYLGETPLYNTTREEDKISFAVEQLKLLKYYIRLDNSDEETGDMPYVVDTDCLFELIDNQIKQLKEMK